MSASKSEDMTPREIAEALAKKAPELAAVLLPGGRLVRGEWRAGSVDGEAGASLGVRLHGRKAGVWADFATEQAGDALDLVMAARRLDKGAAVKWALDWLGLSTEQSTDRQPAPASRPEPLPTREADADAGDRSARALDIVRECMPIAGTPAETYLRARGVDDPCAFSGIAFHRRLKHPSGHVGPALVSVFRDLIDNRPCGIQRIWLSDCGTRKACVTPAKAMLGRAGNAAIKLIDDAEVTHGLGVSEGAETALVTMSRFRWRPIWALGSAGAIARFPVLEGIECLTIFADQDANGVGVKAARTCAARWHDAGRVVAIRVPHMTDHDWADAGCEVAA